MSKKKLAILVAATLFPAALGFTTVLPTTEAQAGVVSVYRVFLVSNRQAKEACYSAEIWWRYALRCEGWFGGSCYRSSLTAPNHVDCYPSFFMSSAIGRKHIDCNRKAHYYAANGGTIRLQRSRSTKWKCRISSGIPS